VTLKVGKETVYYSGQARRGEGSEEFVDQEKSSLIKVHILRIPSGGEALIKTRNLWRKYRRSTTTKDGI